MLKICTDNNDPYINNPEAIAKFPVKTVTYQGNVYQKHSHTLQQKFLTRSIKFIIAIAITLFSCFIALAFQSIRKFWLDTIKDKHVFILKPKNFFENRDITKLIALNLSKNDLNSLKVTSSHMSHILEKFHINQINAGNQSLNDLKIFNIDDLIAFLGEDCGRVTNLDLRTFENITDRDMENISRHFQKLARLVLKEAKITNEAGSFFVKTLKHLELSCCKNIDNFNFLKNCPDLTFLDLSYTEFKDSSILKNCPNLTHLNLERCTKINDISFLESCPKLRYLNVSNCALQSINFSENYPNLTHCILNFNPLQNLNFLKNCSNMAHLEVGNCFFLQDISFLESCPNLTYLNLGGCVKVYVNFSRNYPNLKYLDVSLTKLFDFNFLKNCPTLRYLNASGCALHSINFSETYRNLTHIILNFNKHLQNLDFLKYCPNVTYLEVVDCLWFQDISFLKNCANLTYVNLMKSFLIKNKEDLNFLKNYPNLTLILPDADQP